MVMDETLLSIVGAVRFCPVCSRGLFMRPGVGVDLVLGCFEDGHGQFLVKRGSDDESYWRIEYQLFD